MTTIVTHVSPDFDAIGSVWLLKRHGGMADAAVLFVNTGNPDLDVLASADAVVDTGRVFSPATLRFDHHQLAGAAANETCATLQVAQHLVLARPDVDFNPIWPLIDLIYAGDTGKPAANESRKIGMHALLSAKKASRALYDHGLLAYGFELLDALASGLVAQDAARRSLEAHTVYTSDDGLVVALENAPQGATFAAHEAGARLVLFSSVLPGPSYARGIMRGGEGIDVDAGALVAAIDDPALDPELSTWYRHAAGFFAGKGTAKAPCADPMSVSIVDIARAIDAAWKREAA